MAIPGLNSKVLDKIISTLGLQSAVEKLPTGLAPTIQPIINADPEPEIEVISDSLSNGTTSTIITLPSGKTRTFLHGVALTVSKDAVNDGTNTAIIATAKGKGSESFLTIRYEPLTASSNMNDNLMFVNKIELEPGSNLRILNSSGVSSINSSAVIFISQETIL